MASAWTNQQHHCHQCVLSKVFVHVKTTVQTQYTTSASFKFGLKYVSVPFLLSWYSVTCLRMRGYSISLSLESSWYVNTQSVGQINSIYPLDCINVCRSDIRSAGLRKSYKRAIKQTTIKNIYYTNFNSIDWWEFRRRTTSVTWHSASVRTSMPTSAASADSYSWLFTFPGHWNTGVFNLRNDRSAHDADIGLALRYWGRHETA